MSDESGLSPDRTRDTVSGFDNEQVEAASELLLAAATSAPDGPVGDGARAGYAAVVAELRRASGEHPEQGGVPSLSAGAPRPLEPSGAMALAADVLRWAVLAQRRVTGAPDAIERERGIGERNAYVEAYFYLRGAGLPAPARMTEELIGALNFGVADGDELEDVASACLGERVSG